MTIGRALRPVRLLWIAANVRRLDSANIRCWPLEQGDRVQAE